MTSAYSLKAFLRVTPKAILAEYFQRKQIGLGIDVCVLKERDIGPITAALEQLPRETADKIETDFRNIHQLANDAGAKALHQELTHRGEEGAFDGENSKHSLITITLRSFLEHPEAFDLALLFRPYFDQGRYWRKVSALPFGLPADPHEHVELLTACLKDYFRTREGRGRNCKVDYHRRDTRHFFLAFPEDYPQVVHAWQADELEAIPITPAFEVAFVFDEAQKCLDTCFEGTRQDSQALAETFADAVCSASIPRQHYDKPAYDLGPLKRRNFRFPLTSESGVARMCARKMRFFIPGPEKPQVMISADVDGEKGAEALYDAIERFFVTTESMPSDRQRYAVARPIWVEIASDFKAPNRKGYRRRSFSISGPSSSCTLRHDGEDLILRQILQNAGIETAPGRDTDARQVA